MEPGTAYTSIIMNGYYVVWVILETDLQEEPNKVCWNSTYRAKPQTIKVKNQYDYRYRKLT